MKSCPEPRFDVLPPLSLYIHTPWCIKKCPYCDFNSHAIKSDKLPEKEYLNALVNDFKEDIQWIQDRPINTIFIGGGTPSVLSAEFYYQLFTKLGKIADLKSCKEITLEANPSTFEQEKFIQYRQAGINRLSIGIQSFNQRHLQALGRVHSAEEAEAAIEIAHLAKFNSLNLDLMHGLPRQTLEDSLEDLRTAIRYKPEHLSWYQLTIEPNTVFYSQPPLLPVEDTLAQIQDQGKKLLDDSGFKQYEVSAYSQESGQDLRCLHNLNYWRYGDYIGIGAGAHGKLTIKDDRSNEKQYIIRTNKTRLPKDYISAFSTITRNSPRLKEIEKQEYPFEFLMNALRLNEGFTATLFTARTGLPYSIIEDQIKSLIHEGLLVQKDSKITASELGARFLNSVLDRFL